MVLSTVMCIWNKCWKKDKDKEKDRNKGKESNKSNFDTEMDGGYNKVHTPDVCLPPPPRTYNVSVVMSGHSSSESGKMCVLHFFYTRVG